MNRKELFEKYKIKNSHNEWDVFIDNWCSVEIYRLIRGKLPSPDDCDVTFVCDFLDRWRNDLGWWAENVMSQPGWGSLFLTAKRMVYRYSTEILKQLNLQNQ